MPKKTNYLIAGIPFAFSHVYERFFKNDLHQYHAPDKSPIYHMSVEVEDGIPTPDAPLAYTYKNRHVHEDENKRTIVSYHKDGTIQQRIDQTNDLKSTTIRLNPILGERLDEIEYVLSGLYFFEIAIMEHRFPLHASAVEYRGEAILFAAPSGVGKSTHAAYWESLYGPLRVINDDKPLLFSKDGRIWVAGTPFSGKDSKSANIERPVRAILFLKRGNVPSLRPMTSKEALHHLIKNTFRPGKESLANTLYTLCETIMQKAPIYEATVTHSKESARWIKNELYKEVTMKINPNFILRTVADEHVVVPTGEEGVNFNGIITLNESGKLLFETLKTDRTKQDLIDTLTSTYDVEADQAQQDVEAFLSTLRSKNVLIEDE